MWVPRMCSIFDYVTSSPHPQNEHEGIVGMVPIAAWCDKLAGAATYDEVVAERSVGL